jgi:hypothetical protein
MAFSLLDRPTPIVQFSKIQWEGATYHPNFGDRHSLLLLRRQLPKKVSFPRAYRGWLESGSTELSEFGEGRAFLRWLMKHDLAIDWKKKDFDPHPYFTHPSAPKHDPRDEMARGLSFAIKHVDVDSRKVKLYVQDEDMLNLLSMPFGNEEDFLELVMRYVAQRFEWAKWKAPAPLFLDWVKAQGRRPVFNGGDVGFYLHSLTSFSSL